MEKLDYNKIINDNTAILIDSYVDQYGEKYRNIITERFKKIKFCFYTTPSEFAMYIQLKGQDIYTLYIVKCLKEIGITNVRYYGGRIIINDNEKVKKLLAIIFGGEIFDILSEFQELEVNKISDKDIEFIEDMTGKKIQEVINIVNRYIKDLSGRDYLNAFLKANEICARVPKINMENYKAFILNDFDLEQFVNTDKILSAINSRGVIACSQMELCKTGEYVPVVYFSPLCTKYRYLDIIFDHEVRHAIEMSMNTKCNKLKCGLSFVDIDNSDTVYIKHSSLNEVMTQKMSIESTKKRYKKGIYIFSDKELVDDYSSTGYDKFIPKFEESVDEDLYSLLVDARINDSYPISIEDKISKLDVVVEKQKRK